MRLKEIGEKIKEKRCSNGGKSPVGEYIRDSGSEQGVKGEVAFEEEPKPEQCVEHECGLMYDDNNNFYYCPLCEK